MRIRVRFFTVLRELTGKSEEELEVKEEADVEDILDLLSGKYGERVTDYLFEEGKVRSQIQILLDGKKIGGLDGLKTKLRDRETLAIIPPVGGGS